jgi:hypothetical protein
MAFSFSTSFLGDLSIALGLDFSGCFNFSGDFVLMVSFGLVVVTIFLTTGSTAGTWLDDFPGFLLGESATNTNG